MELWDGTIFVRDAALAFGLASHEFAALADDHGLTSLNSNYDVKDVRRLAMKLAATTTSDRDRERYRTAIRLLREPAS